MAQAVEVHVGTAGDGDQVLTLDIVFRNVSLQAGRANAPAGSVMLRGSSKYL